MARKSKTGLQHVKAVTAKGRQYLYFDTGQKDEHGKKIFKALPSLADKSFGGVYAAMMGHRSRRETADPVITVRDLIIIYQKSPKWTKLSKGSQRLYGIYLAELQALLGMAPANQVSRDDVVLMIDRRADKPGAANSLLRTTAALYKWARERGHVTIDPCRDIAMLEVGEHEPWPDALIEKALKADDEYVRLAVHLLYFTAQRIGDVLTMKFSDIEDGLLRVVQQKTGKELYVPMHKDLRAEIAKHGRQLGPIIVGARGKRIGQSILRQRIQDWAEAQGHRVVPHGLRKNAVIALLEAGCTVAEAASISGQSLQMVEHYARRRDQKRLAQKAMDRWERG